MARPLRRLTPALGGLPIAIVWAVPLVLSLLILIPAAADAGAWGLLFLHPQLWPGLCLSLLTGAASTTLALAASLIILAGLQGTRAWRTIQAFAAAGLAVPHLAFAIGFGFLIMPSGLLARILAGGDTPPDWITVQDPLGLSLTLALALKEIPFLLTAGIAALSRGDAAGRQALEMRAAASLGHGAGSAWMRIVLPQLLPSLAWPLIIVFVYGATVTDMALVLGPTQPPTLAVVIWHALNDADPAVNTMGLTGTLLLTAALILSVAIAAMLLRLSGGPRRRLLTAGPSFLAAPLGTGLLLGAAGIAILVLCILLLGLLSMAPRWPYPAILPPLTGAAAWQMLAASPAPLWLSLGLSLAVAASATALAVLWFETQAPPRDRWVLGLALLALALPQLAMAGGQYRLFLSLGLTGTLPGLFLAHLTPAVAYALIVLQGPYRAFDGRYMQAARALCVSGLGAWAKVKLPLLKAPLLTTAAIAFAVSIAQFVPAQLIAAGRHSTLPMEAVTLASGGNRSLTAAFALALTLPPLLAFLAAALLGRPRWR
jgi:putative thiamine transport system permease protein